MDERLIIKQCQAGDKEAFGILYQTYLVPMRKIVAYYVHCREAVQDILHDGFLIAFASIGSLKKAEKVEAWLTSIMKNLALQYLKEEAGRISVPLSNVSVADETDGDCHRNREITWEELNKIINRLPEGYGKVFRLSVLDSMSHKEIGALLGIAPHSSSSQLAHAKAMLRRLIVQYRIEMGVLTTIGVILFLWHGMFKHRDKGVSTPAISRHTGGKTSARTDDATDGDNGDMAMKQTVVYKTATPPARGIISDVAPPKDSIPPVGNDSVDNDTVRRIPDITNRRGLIAKDHLPQAQSEKTSGWSLSLAYSGTSGQNESNRYRTPGTDIPSTEVPSGDVEVTEKTHHHAPVTIGLSLNKTLTSRWSIGTGIRYSFLRSDFRSESKLTSTETVQRIHYIGIPLKLNYRIFTHSGFSLYGQGGGALDIPVYGSRSVWERSPESGEADNSKARIHAPLQWSVEGGLGLQYHFTPSVSIYAEPSFRYYLNPGSEIKTLRQEKPFEFTMPVGLRLTW